MTTQPHSAEVIRLSRKTNKPKVLAENAGLLAFIVSEPAPIIDIAPRIRAKRQAKPLQDRIDRLTDKSAGPDGVWKWKGSRSQVTGYPQISWHDTATDKRVTRAVHRVLMELKLGRRLLRNEHVLHDRGVPKDDVNPAHHRVGTQQENLDDAKAEGKLRGKLQPRQILKIASLHHRDHVEIGDIAFRFNVSRQTIHNIVTGKTHSKITGRTYVPGKSGRPCKAVLQVEHQSKRGQPSAPRVLEAVI
jgi:hypothetical protein